MNLSFIAFVIAAVCFFLAWIEASIGHVIEAGFFFVALGHALSHLPAWPNRGP